MDRIKRLSFEVLNDHKTKFGEDFTENKKALNQISIIRSKGLKNKVAGYITRFNKILEKISVDTATKTSNSNVPQRVLVAFDSHATGLREVQLMARLVRDFPGANTRIILLLDKRSSTQVEKKIEYGCK